MSSKEEQAVTQSNSCSVQGTNDHSILSKHAMCKAGYSYDPFLQSFTLKSAPRRSPLINRGYYIRDQAVQISLHSFLKESTSDSAAKQIISLGAGFDTSFFKLSTQSNDTLSTVYYVEVDFPEVAERKRMLIERSDLCRSVIDTAERFTPTHSCVKLATSQYCLLGIDLADVSLLAEVFSSHTKLAMELPTLLLSECVMTYMEPALSSQLIQHLHSLFPCSVFITYEQVVPGDSFGLFMQSHFTKLNSSLRGINTYPTKQAQRERYLATGYNKVDVLTMKEVYDSLSLAEKNRIWKLELFDEFEEWNLKCYHYVLVLARSDASFTHLELLIDSFLQSSPLNAVDVSLDLVPAVCSGVSAEQYGHTSCLLSSEDTEAMLLTHGGFGVDKGQHCRQNRLRFYSVSLTDSSLVFRGYSDVLSCRLHHTFTPLSDSKIFVFGGRLSPAKPFAHPVVLSVAVNSEGESVITASDIESGGSEPQARWRHAAVCVRLDGVDHVVITGGLMAVVNSGDSAALTSCHMFNTSTHVWSSLPSYQQPLHSHALCYDGCSYLYSVGGLCGREKVTADCYRLDLTCLSDGWGVVPLPVQPVFGHTMHLVGGKMVVVGGIGEQGQQMGVQIVNLSPIGCRHLNLPIELDSSLRMYFNHSSHVLSAPGTQPRILVTGGGGNCFSFGTHINKNISFLSLCDILE